MRQRVIPVLLAVSLVLGGCNSAEKEDIRQANRYIEQMIKSSRLCATTAEDLLEEEDNMTIEMLFEIFDSFVAEADEAKDKLDDLPARGDSDDVHSAVLSSSLGNLKFTIEIARIGYIFDGVISDEDGAEIQYSIDSLRETISELEDIRK